MAVLNSILSYLQYCQILIQCSIASRFKNSQLIRLSCFVPLIRNNATSMAVFNIKKKKKNYNRHKHNWGIFEFREND